jgi:hypothetical protein
MASHRRGQWNKVLSTMAQEEYSKASAARHRADMASAMRRTSVSGERRSVSVPESVTAMGLILVNDPDNGAPTKSESI